MDQRSPVKQILVDRGMSLSLRTAGPGVARRGGGLLRGGGGDGADPPPRARLPPLQEGVLDDGHLPSLVGGAAPGHARQSEAQPERQTEGSSQQSFHGGRFLRGGPGGPARALGGQKFG